MFFATTAPAQFRRPASAQAGDTLDRLLEEALRPNRSQGCAYPQDETVFSLALDMPGIAKDQLSIAIEGAVIRITSKEGALRKYRAANELPQDIDADLSPHGRPLRVTACPPKGGRVSPSFGLVRVERLGAAQR